MRTFNIDEMMNAMGFIKYEEHSRDSKAEYHFYCGDLMKSECVIIKTGKNHWLKANKR
jgi:hypothetical protein